VTAECGPVVHHRETPSDFRFQREVTSWRSRSRPRKTKKGRQRRCASDKQFGHERESGFEEVGKVVARVRGMISEGGGYVLKVRGA
jgi:hypothetical protein